jgi:hypothetical protein
MVAPVKRIGVLRFTGITHLKKFHGSVFTVIGKIINNGVSYPTMGTGNEGVAVPAVRRVEKLLLTLLTDTDIRGDTHRTFSLLLRLYNTKVIKKSRLYMFGLHRLYGSKRGKLFFNTLKKGIELLRSRVHNDLHSSGTIGDRSGKCIACSKLIDERAEAYSLYGTENIYSVCSHPITSHLLSCWRD